VDWTSIWTHLTHLDVPVTEKVLRTVLVYGGLVVLMRVAGKRVLSQLNTFDLVVVLLLSNVVQNAIIGPDNSVLGGLIGAVVLVAVNAVWERVATASSATSRVVEGSPSILVRDGVADLGAIARVGLRLPEVMAALHRQGADRIQDVEVASLEPGGAIRMELTEDARSASYGELRAAVAELRSHLDERLSALESALEASMGSALSPTVRPAPSPPGPSPAP
jgi:uncharacterized membrane protein YcaP (DUF421 family)